MDNNGKEKREKKISTSSNISTNPFVFTSTSEATAKIIIEKLISLTITQSFIVNLEEKIPDECFDFTQKITKGYLSSAFIQYERDEYKVIKDKPEAFPNFDVEEIQQRDQSETGEVINNELSMHDNLLDAHPMFFDNHYRGENDWSTPAEPNSVEIDRYASSYIDIGKEGKEFKDQQQQQQIDTDPRSNGVKGATIVSSTISSHYYYRSANAKEKKKKKYSFEINNEDIPLDELQFKEPDDLNINDLRKEKDEEIKKLEEEKKKVIIKQIESQEKIKETANIQKEYEKKKITIDANGKIVFIKQYPTERLPSEFITAKAEHKDIIRRKSITKDKAKARDKDKDNAVVKENILQLEQGKGTTLHIKDDKKEKEIISPTKDKKVTPVLPIFLGKDNKKKELQTIQPSDPAINSLALLEKKIERGPIYPCGSCFDIIALEVGVSFTEEKKYKTGGKDYLKAFNKYSVDNYDKQVKDTVGMQTLPNQAYRTTTDYNNYTTRYNNLETYPSQFNNTSTSRGNLHQAYDTHTKMIMTNRSSLNPFIKTGRINLPSLTSAIDVLDLTRGKFDNVEGQYPLPEDIFKAKVDKQQHSKRRHQQQLDPINNFTQSILSHDKWGMNIGKYNKQPEASKIPLKPKKDLINDFKNRVPHKMSRLTIQNNPFSVSMDNFTHYNTLSRKTKQ